jgi:hypothetical protein
MYVVTKAHDRRVAAAPPFHAGGRSPIRSPVPGRRTTCRLDLYRSSGCIQAQSEAERGNARLDRPRPWRRSPMAGASLKRTGRVSGP